MTDEQLQEIRELAALALQHAKCVIDDTQRGSIMRRNVADLHIASSRLYLAVVDAEA